MREANKSRAVVLLSGGMDSCVCAALAAREFGAAAVHIRYGQRTTVIALPAAEVFLTPRGLDHVGPRAFGYDLDFNSVFQS